MYQFVSFDHLVFIWLSNIWDKESLNALTKVIYIFYKMFSVLIDKNCVRTDCNVLILIGATESKTVMMVPTNQ